MFWNLHTVIVGVAVLVHVSCPGLAAEDRLVGKYSVEGTYAWGKKYGPGTVAIAKRGETYEVVWSGFGEPSLKGVGILDGDIFAANFVDSSDGDGVMLLRRQGGKWVGRWVVVPGKGEIHQETWTKVK
jgi:hypothetical protein